MHVSCDESGAVCMGLSGNILMSQPNDIRLFLLPVAIVFVFHYSLNANACQHIVTSYVQLKNINII